MTPVSTTPEREPQPENWDAAIDFAEIDADDACLPALARQFRITDLQHWIDLCA